MVARNNGGWSQRQTPSRWRGIVTGFRIQLAGHFRELHVATLRQNPIGGKDPWWQGTMVAGPSVTPLVVDGELPLVSAYSWRVILESQMQRAYGKEPEAEWNNGGWSQRQTPSRRRGIVTGFWIQLAAHFRESNAATLRQGTRGGMEQWWPVPGSTRWSLAGDCHWVLHSWQVILESYPQRPDGKDS